MELLQWWNLIFLLPAVAALLYLLLLTFGALPSEGHDFDSDAGTHDGAHEGGPGDHDPFHGALSLIGVGRVPLSLILMSLGLLWGFFGWLGNGLFGSVIAAPAVFIWPSILLALIGAVTFTRFLARALGRIMPATESYGADARALVGRIADVRYPLSESAGTVQILDAHGSLHEVPARVLPGEAAIPAGARVVLWRFDAGTGSYLAIEDEALNGIAAGDPRSGPSLVA